MERFPLPKPGGGDLVYRVKLATGSGGGTADDPLTFDLYRKTGDMTTDTRLATELISETQYLRDVVYEFRPVGGFDWSWALADHSTGPWNLLLVCGEVQMTEVCDCTPPEEEAPPA